MQDLSITNYLTLFAGSFIVSLGLTPLVRSWAIMTNRVAVPKDSRWHKKETALLGGVSIYVSTMAVWVLSVAVIDWTHLGMPYLPVMICSTAVFVLGLADDILNMDPQHKLAAQFVIASVLIFFGFRLEWTFSETANLFISLIWMVGITNAFNLLDNMDGLSAGIALIAGIFIFLTYYLNPAIGASAGHVMIMCSAYLGALLGFLVYNFNPASIFMGDAGSLFLGFILAVVGIKLRFPEGLQIVTWMVPVLVLGLPLFDTALVVVSRLRRGLNPLTTPGKDHVSHRLVAMGYTSREAVMICYLACAALGVLAIFVTQASIIEGYIVGAVVLVVALWAIWKLERVDFPGKQMRGALMQRWRAR